MLATWKKSYDNLDSILKRRDITLLTKVCLFKAMVFPTVMYGCESWTIRKAECQRIEALKLWCWRRLLRVPWSARRSNLSILKKINPEFSLEELMLKLKLQYFGYLMQTVRDFTFLGSKITADGDCSHEIKRCLLLGRKAMTSLDIILKSRDNTLPTKAHIVKPMFFQVVMYRYVS